MKKFIPRIIRVPGRLAKSILAKDQNRALVARWARDGAVAANWGDKLNPYLIEQISGKRVLHQSEVFVDMVPAVHCVIGSLLGQINLSNAVVWGAGFLSSGDLMPVVPKAIHAVRGHLSNRRLLEQGLLKEEVPVGDPALLMPLLYRPNATVVHDIGVIPHFRDHDLPIVRSLNESESFKVIDVCSGVGEFCDQITSCRQIISSSLHGLIAAHSYGIPAKWVRLSERPKGDGFKFRDYLSSISAQTAVPAEARSVSDIEGVARENSTIPSLPSIGALLDCCPFISPEELARLKGKIALAYGERTGRA